MRAAGADGTGGMDEGLRNWRNRSPCRCAPPTDLELRGQQLSQGQDPPAFDLLYWNGDSTNLPGPMYLWYIRNFYLDNKLTRNMVRINMLGEDVDLALSTCRVMSIVRGKITSCRGRALCIRRNCGAATSSSSSGASGIRHHQSARTPKNAKPLDRQTRHRRRTRGTGQAKRAPAAGGLIGTPAGPHSGETVAAPGGETKLGAAPGTYVLAKA